MSSSGRVSNSERVRRGEAEIAENIRGLIKEMLGDAVDRDVLKELIRRNPAIITQYLPKAKEIDGGLVESHLSLLRSYELLPELIDLSELLRGLESELGRVRYELEVERRYNRELLDAIFQRLRVMKADVSISDMLHDFHKLLRVLEHYYFRMFWENSEVRWCRKLVRGHMLKLFGSDWEKEFSLRLKRWREVRKIRDDVLLNPDVYERRYSESALKKLRKRKLRRRRAARRAEQEAGAESLEEDGDVLDGDGESESDGAKAKDKCDL